MSVSPDSDARVIPAGTHGRYLVDWPVAPPRGLVVGFHGYGENARIHLSALAGIGAPGWALVSVQALNRFYTRGETVVASWMTREDREWAIRDNLAYVRSVIEAVDREFGRVTPLVYAGFSQGVAMAYRAARSGARPCQGLIALAGDVPPDVRDAGGPLPRMLLGRGTTDTWYTEDKMSLDVEALTAMSTHVETCVFEGGHEWAAAFFDAAKEFLGGLETDARARDRT